MVGKTTLLLQRTTNTTLTIRFFIEDSTNFKRQYGTVQEIIVV